MIKAIAALLLIGSILTANANCELKSLNADKTDINQFEQAFLDLKNDMNNTQKQLAYFLHFPKDFKTLDRYFGLKMEKNGSIINSVLFDKYSFEPYELFFNLSLPAECIIDKTMAVLKNGISDYDNLDHFFSLPVNDHVSFIKKYPKESIDAIQKHSDKEILEFWRAIMSSYEFPNEKDLKWNFGSDFYNNMPDRLKKPLLKAMKEEQELYYKYHR